MDNLSEQQQWSLGEFSFMGVVDFNFYAKVKGFCEKVSGDGKILKIKDFKAFAEN